MIHTDQQVPCLDPKNWILAHRSMQSLACKDIAYERDIGFPEQVGVKWDSEKSKKWDEFPKVHWFWIYSSTKTQILQNFGNIKFNINRSKYCNIVHQLIVDAPNLWDNT